MPRSEAMGRGAEIAVPAPRPAVRKIVPDGDEVRSVDAGPDWRHARLARGGVITRREWPCGVRMAPWERTG